MIKVIANQDFNYKNASRLYFHKKQSKQVNFISKGDEFDCTEEEFDYLTGNNPTGLCVVFKVEKQKEEKEEVVENVDNFVDKPKKKTTKKKKAE